MEPTTTTHIRQLRKYKRIITIIFSISLLGSVVVFVLHHKNTPKTEYEKAYEAAIEFRRNGNPMPEATLYRATFYCWQGIEKNLSGQYIAAITEFDEAIRIKPDHAKAYLLRGLSRFELKKYALSKFDFNMALDLDSDFSELSVDDKLMLYAHLAKIEEKLFSP